MARISQAAAQSGISTSAIRFYDKQALLQQVQEVLAQKKQALRASLPASQPVSKRKAVVKVKKAK